MNLVRLALLSSLIFGSFISHAASTSYSGDYTCENEHMIGDFNLDDQRHSHFLSVRIERKKSGIVNQYSGAASKTSLGERGLTVFAVDNQKLYFNPDGTIIYNGSIGCSKK